MAWQAIIGEIAGALFNSIIEWIDLFILREQKEAAEWAAKSKELQLESMKEGKQQEKELREAMNNAVISTTDDEWNAKAEARNARNRTIGALGLLVGCLMLSGCFRFYVSAREYRPVLPVPEAPIFTPDMTIEEKYRAVREYAERLEIVVDGYNEEAVQRNISNGYLDAVE